MTETMTPTSDERREQSRLTFRGVQALRGLAAAMVVAFHATIFWSEHAGGRALALVWNNGSAGVDIFFVISGFVMTVSTVGKEHRSHPARAFLERRLVRIAPLYWLATVLVLLKIVVVNRHPGLANAEQHARTTLSYVASSFLFIPYRNSLGKVEPILNAGWTLSFEMSFYALFAAALALRVRVALWLTPAMIGLVISGVLARLVFGQHLPGIATLTNPILLEFLAGVLLGQSIISGYRLNLRLACLLGVFGLVILLIKPWNHAPQIRVLEWGLPAAFVVAAAVTLEERFGHVWPKWSLKLGDASYSLYLFHPLVIAFVAKLLTRTSIVTRGRVRLVDELATVVIVLCVCVPVALLIYRFVERPLTQWLRQGVERWGVRE